MKFVFLGLLVILAMSCGMRTIESGGVIQYNGKEYKVKLNANIGIFVWQYDFYEKVTLSNGDVAWVKADSDKVEEK